MRLPAAILCMALAAASLQRPAPLGPAREFRQALSLLRNGAYAEVAARAHQARIALPDSQWQWRFRLLEAEALVELGQPAASQTALEAGPDQAPPEFEIRRRILAARQISQRGRDLDRAEQLVAEATRRAGDCSRPDLQPEIDVVLGQILARRGKIVPAENVLRGALKSASDSGDAYWAAASVNSLGMVRVSQYRYDLAIPLFEQAKQLYARAGAIQWVAAADNNMVMCYSRLGDFDKALPYSEEALRLARPSTLLANSLGETGMAYYLQHDPEKAILYFRKACAMAHKFTSRVAEARWAGNLSQALADTGDWDGAEEALREAINVGPESRSRVYLDLDSALIDEGRQRFAEARAAYEKAMASVPENPGVQWVSYAGIARTAAGDVALANRSSEAALRVIEQSQSSLPGNDNQMKFLARLIRFYQDYVDSLLAQNQSIKALAVADGSRARVLSQRFEGRLKADTPHQEADYTTLARQSGAVWLSYWLAPNRSFLWVTTPKEIRVFTLKASASEIATLVEEYRGFVESMRDPIDVENEAGRRLYEILIAPAATLIPPGAPVIVVPDGPLHQLSFETVPVYGAPRAHYWIEDHAVAVALSFAVFRGGSPRPGGSRRTLLIGDTVSPGPGFPKLDFAAGEIANVERRLASGITKYVREEARPEIWKQTDPGKFDIIHFAAHAEANRRSPLDSAIILSPGSGFRLSARDIIGEPLNAGLVTLSACRSSGARTYPGEGLVGLTWAFLQAGSRNVVAGLWDVADESTSLLMDRFYEGIAKGAEPAEALRNAQLALLRTDYAKPYYWGPFQCYRR